MYFKKVITHSTSACVLALLISVFGMGTVSAQTPDGETPANEGVCDELTTATKGLYGLCVAYCEALDCEFVGNQVQCSKPANEKILQNYNKKKQAGDPEMPCIKTDCPCWDAAELDPLVPVTVTSCSNNLDLDAASTTCTGINNPLGSCGALLTVGGALVTSEPARNRTFCFLTTGSGSPTRFHIVTRAEAEACAAQIRDVGAVHGWACFP